MPLKAGKPSLLPIARVTKNLLRRRHVTPVQRKASVEELLAIADRAAAFVDRPYVNHAELLYDESGLPQPWDEPPK